MFIKSTCMKAKFFSAVVICITLTNAAFSQKLSLGVKAGLDLHKVTGKSFDEEYKAGFNAGAFAEVKIQKIGIQPEVYFSQVNAQSRKDFSSDAVLSGLDTKIKLSYLNIPILINYYFTKNVALQAGPQMGILVNQNISAVQNAEDAFKKGDFSLTAGLQVKISRFRVFGRYIVGLNNIDDIKSAEKWKNQTIHLGLAYAIL